MGLAFGFGALERPLHKSRTREMDPKWSPQLPLVDLSPFLGSWFYNGQKPKCKFHCVFVSTFWLSTWWWEKISCLGTCYQIDKFSNEIFGNSVLLFWCSSRSRMLILSRQRRRWCSNHYFGQQTNRPVVFLCLLSGVYNYIENDVVMRIYPLYMKICCRLRRDSWRLQRF